MSILRVLFLCVHNADRSQMAEALLNHLGEGVFKAESAGFQSTAINPLAIQVMKEIGIDISNSKTKEAFDLYKEGRIYHYVISVCDETKHEKCPLFPGVLKRLTWSYPNPAGLLGSEDDKLEKIREIRDAMKLKIEEFIREIKIAQNLSTQ